MKPWKLVTVALWALAIASVAAYAVVRLAGPTAPSGVAASIDYSPQTLGAAGELPVLFPAATFALTDHNGQAFASEHLRGKVWVGFLFLTNCPTGACPTMVGKMADLQSALPDAQVHFVSFSIDPARDTPGVLKSYATQVGGSEPSSRWHLLTGTSRQEMREVAASMKLGFDDSNQHSTWFLLVDAAGNVRGLYGNSDEGAMERLRRDAAQIAAETPRRGA